VLLPGCCPPGVLGHGCPEEASLEEATLRLIALEAEEMGSSDKVNEKTSSGSDSPFCAARGGRGTQPGKSIP
jgi:hypothetical protein